MNKTLTLLALASAALLTAACGESNSQPPIPPEGRPVQRVEKALDHAPQTATGGAQIVQIGANGECGLYEVTHKGRTFYMATRQNAGSCALLHLPEGSAR